MKWRNYCNVWRVNTGWQKESIWKRKQVASSAYMRTVCGTSIFSKEEMVWVFFHFPAWNCLLLSPRMWFMGHSVIINPAGQKATTVFSVWTRACKKEGFELGCPGWSVKPLSFWFKEDWKSSSVHILLNRGMRTGDNYWIEVFKTIRVVLTIFCFWQECISSRADWVFKPVGSNYRLFSLSHTEQATLLQVFLGVCNPLLMLLLQPPLGKSWLCSR